QAFNGRSFVTLTNTSVLRNGNNRDANVTSLDYGLYDRTNTYSVTGAFRYSTVFGETPYYSIAAPYRYISSVDTVHRNGQTTVLPYDGFSGRLRLAKQSGRLQYSLGANLESDTYDPNDLGLLQAPNKVTYSGQVTWHQFQPTRNFLNYNYGLQVRNEYLYRPYAFSQLEITTHAFWLLKNMWDIQLVIGGEPVSKRDYFELRTPGRFLRQPRYFYAFVEGSTDSRKRLYVSYDLGFAEADMPNNPYYSTEIGLRYRFSNQFNLSLNLERNHDNNQIGYAFAREANGEPIVGFRDWKEVSAILSGNYNFTSRMNLTLRARHYWSRLEYNSFRNVTADGHYTPRAFVDGMDGNFNAFNVDAFFTWDFRPGSRVILGWKNWLGDDYQSLSNVVRNRYYNRNLSNALSLPHTNEVTLRVIYFLDYNQLRGRR
ncbi:MAG TPA: DUF5916 domain-containing protein, partial [Chitinophagaceae bacterium]|nr:DUF5916 domain-containing protein [Chitinophagaceae bacterium]